MTSSDIPHREAASGQIQNSLAVHLKSLFEVDDVAKEGKV